MTWWAKLHWRGRRSRKCTFAAARSIHQIVWWLLLMTPFTFFFFSIFASYPSFSYVHLWDPRSPKGAAAATQKTSPKICFWFDYNLWLMKRAVLLSLSGSRNLNKMRCRIFSNENKNCNLFWIWSTNYNKSL